MFYFKHYFWFFNFDEHVAVPSVELARGGFSVGHFHFFLATLDYLSEHFHSHTGLIVLIAQNLLYYLHFAFCLFVCLIHLWYIPHPSHNWYCSVTYPEFFGQTCTFAEPTRAPPCLVSRGKFFLNLCLQMLQKCPPWPLLKFTLRNSLLRGWFSKSLQYRKSHAKQFELFL